MLKVTGYRHDGLVHDEFPTILYEGHMGGEEWDEKAIENDMTPDIVAVEGSVSLLLDGSVRWHMVRFVPKLGLLRC